jgi:hypothetical protein
MQNECPLQRFDCRKPRFRFRPTAVTWQRLVEGPAWIDSRHLLRGYLGRTFANSGLSSARPRVRIRKNEADQLDPWIAEVSGSLVSSFATGVARDKAAIRAAIVELWSNGQVEAQITKLKLVKRQMYGRAKLDLLQARLLGAA